MPDDFDLGRQLAQSLDDRADTWEFIRRFAYHWISPLREGDGCDAAELAAAEARLGIELPAAVREAYTLFGRRDDLTGNMHALLGPAELHVDDKDALVFRTENQGAATWGILRADLKDPDPPVRIRADLADKDAETWEPWLDRFSLTCLEMVLSESLEAPEHLTDYRDLSETETETLEQHYTLLPTLYSEYRWFTGRDLLICDVGGGLMARGRTEEALDDLYELFPDGWVNA